MTEKEFVSVYEERLLNKVAEYSNELKNKATSNLEDEVALRFQNLSEYQITLITEIIDENNIDAFQRVSNYLGTHHIPYGMRLVEISMESQWLAIKKFNDFTSSLG